MNYEKAVNQTVEAFKKDWIIFSVSTIIVLAVSIVTLGLLAAPMYAGLGSMFVNSTKGRKPVFNDLFIYSGKFFFMLVMGFLIAVPVIIGCFLLVIPGLILATFWMYSIYAMAFDNKGIIESMKTSWNFVAKNGLWQNLLVLIAVGVFQWLGGAIFIGILVTVPMSAGFLGILYEENKL